MQVRMTLNHTIHKCVLYGFSVKRLMDRHNAAFFAMTQAFKPVVGIKA